MRWLKKALGLLGRQRAETLVTRGYVAAKEGRPAEALRLYEEAAQADETVAVAWLNAALCHLEAFNSASAALGDAERERQLSHIAALLERAVALPEVPVSAWRTLARVQERLAAFVRAEECWQRVVDSPGGGLAQQEAQTALEDLRPQAELQRALLRGSLALSADVDEDERRAAWQALQHLLEAPPTRVELPPRAWALAGSLARKLRDFDSARPLLEEAVRRDPADLETLRELASLYVDVHELPLALQTSVEAYRRNPLDAGLVCNVGVCHLALGDSDKAREFLTIARDMAPADPIVQRALRTLSDQTASASP